MHNHKLLHRVRSALAMSEAAFMEARRRVAEARGDEATSGRSLDG